MRRFGILVCSASLAAIATTTPAFANEPEADEHGPVITVTATRTPTDVNDVPATVTIISEQQIADELATDIKDLVRFEPGVSVARQPARFGAALGTTGRTGNEGFNIRGIGGNRVLIQVDGVRVPDGFTFGAQGVGRGDYVDIGLVKSVEILRGPTSALYGSDGLAGAVSFVTSDPSDFLSGGKNFGGLVRAAYSSADNEFSETAILAGRSGTLSGMIAYSRRDYDELDNQGSLGTGMAGSVNIGVGNGSTRTAPNPQDGRSDALLGRIVWEPTGGHKVRLTGEYVDTRLDANVLSSRSTTVVDLRAHDTGSRKRVGLDWTWSGEGVLEFSRLAAYWQQGKDRQFTFEDRNPAVDRTRINTFDNRVYGASAEARLAFGDEGFRNRVVVGGDISFTRQQGLRDGTIPPAGESFPSRAFPVTDYTLVGLFIADEMEFADGLVTLYPALRFDHYKLSPKNDALLHGFTAVGQSDSHLSPKLGAVIKLDENVRLFGGWSRGFKAPEPSQVNQFFENIAFGYTSRPNPDLGPEQSESFEAGLRLLGRHTTLTVSMFKANYKDFISQEVVDGSFTPADPAVYQFINVGKVKLKGIEAKFEGRTDSGFTGNLALSYASGTVDSGNDSLTRLSTIDPLKLVVGVGYRSSDDRFGGQLIATHSARKSASSTDGVCTGAPCYRPNAFTIVDATMFARFGDLTLRAGVFNILDKKYSWWSDVRGMAMSPAPGTSPIQYLTPATADAYTQPGRNASVSLSYRF